MTSSFPSFASFPEPEEDAQNRSRDKKERRKREKERDKGRERRKARERSPPSPSRSREQSSKRERDRERRDKKRRREKDNEERGWRPEDDVQDKGRQDRLLAEGRELASTPGAQPWFSDLKGDQGNITFGKLYKGHVPKFRRAVRE